MWTIFSLAIALATLAFTALPTALVFSVFGSSGDLGVRVPSHRYQ